MWALIYWLPPLLYIALIFRVSSIRQLTPPMPFYWFDKVLHGIEYLVLGFLLARAWRVTLPKQTPAAVGLAALACGIVVGTADEFYQSFVPGRSSSPWDLLADTVGLCLAQIVVIAMSRSTR